ncbi:MAG TPA: hypothetical protein VF100_00705, partial [Thermoanaerobaculia bacterium]
MLRDRRRPAVVALPLLLIAVLAAADAVTAAEPAERDAPPSTWDRFVAPVLAGGGSGLAFFPSTSGNREDVVDPRGFSVHLTPADDPGEELVHPAGVPFQPPPGCFRVWMQGGDWISPSSRLIVFPRRRDEVVRPDTVTVGSTPASEVPASGSGRAAKRTRCAASGAGRPSAAGTASSARTV